MAKKASVIEGLDGFTLGADVGSLVFIPTGHPQLDFAIARGVLQDPDNSSSDNEMLMQGGVPLGKLIEIYGEEGGGKSSIAYRIVGNAQKMGYRCAWIDTEHSFSEQLAKINGVNVDDVAYADLTHADDPEKVDDAEAIIDKMIAVCKSGKIQVVVLDSVAFMSPKYTMEHDADKMSVGALARTLSTHLPKLANYASKHKVLCVFINQLREKIGVLWGDPETTPGGRALKHACSVRLKVSKANGKSSIIEIENENGETEVVGGKAYVMIKKNRFAAPVRDSIEIPIYYKFYFPNFADHLFNTGRQLNVIRIHKNTYSYGDIKEIGKSAFMSKIASDTNALKQLVQDVIQKAEEKEFALPPEILTYMEKNKSGETEADEIKIDESPKSKKVNKKKAEKQTDQEVVHMDDLNL